MGNSAAPICAKLPEDLEYALRDRAEAEGISVSEITRHAIAAFVFGSIPGAQEGYAQAKRLATQMALQAMHNGLASLPDTLEEWIDLQARGG